jgi:mannosyl-oligosaccharide glucosidase
MECAKSAFSNLMGGYILAYGDLYCETSEPACQDPKMMLTMTPSREGFPRPFLWDDGFHNMVACKWNPNLCLQTLSDWMSTMTEDGWIPREQARGDELRSYFPSHFNGFQLKQQR